MKRVLKFVFSCALVALIVGNSQSILASPGIKVDAVTNSIENQEM